MPTTVIRGGRVVTATEDHPADVLVEDEQVVAIAETGRLPAADREIDATGLLVLPGGVDPHTHLELPFGGTTSVDDFTSGTGAAAVGGTTTIIDFPAQARGQDLRDTFEAWQDKLRDHPPHIDVAFHTIISDIREHRLGELRALVAEGVTSFKLFTAYKDALMLDDEAIFRVMLECADLGAMAMVHAENGGVIDVLVERALRAQRTAPRFHAETRPVLAEAEAAYRALALARMANSPVYLVHVSTRDALHHIEEAQRAGHPAFGETCPQYLFLDDSVYDSDDTDVARFVFTPPARALEHQRALWQGVRRGTLSAVSTDHCPFCLQGQKSLGFHDFSKIPNGAPGIEHRLPLLYTAVTEGRVSLNDMVDRLSTGPARLFGLFPRKGTIAVGSDADLILFDPRPTSVITAATQTSRVDYTLYEGRAVRGAVHTVLSRGTVVVDGGKLVGPAGHGRYLRRGPSGTGATAAEGAL